MAIQRKPSGMLTPSSDQRTPIGAVTPYDPGIFKDAAGGFFTGTGMSDLQYAGDNPGVFRIGQGPASQAGAASPSSAGLPQALTAKPPMSDAGESRAIDKPRDIHPGQMPVTPMPSTAPGAAQAAPARPSMPSPVAAQPPAPFVPMTPTMTPSQTVTPTQGGLVQGQHYPLTGLRQYDPGIFTDDTHYFTADGTYRGDDPSVFNIGKPSQAAPARPSVPTPAVSQTPDPYVPQTASAPAPSPTAQSAPARPIVPSPVAAQPPTTYTPSPGITPKSVGSSESPSMTASSQAMGDQSPIVRRGLVPGTADAPRQRLFGNAGGLLGGGLGVPGLGAAGPDDISTLIAQILKMAGQR